MNAVLWLPLAVMLASNLFTFRGRRDLDFAGQAAGNVLAVIVFWNFPLWMRAIFTVAAAINAWRWWKHRRKGRWKRTAKALGAKSKARIAALVRSLKPAPPPRPLRPVRIPS